MDRPKRLNLPPSYAATQLPRKAVDTTRAAARRGIRAVLIGVRGVPRRQRAGGALLRAHAVGVSDLAEIGGCRRRPVGAGQSGRERAVGVGAGHDVVLVRRRRSGPLYVDPLAALVDEDRRVA